MTLMKLQRKPPINHKSIGNVKPFEAKNGAHIYLIDEAKKQLEERDITLEIVGLVYNDPDHTGPGPKEWLFESKKKIGNKLYTVVFHNFNPKILVITAYFELIK